MQREADSPVLFIDRSLGRGVVKALRDAGASVESHDDHFPQDAPDESWLARAGRDGWIVITKDRRIRYRPNEIEAFRQHRVIGVFLTNANATGAENASLLVRALPDILSLKTEASAPAFYTLSSSGKLKHWF